MYSLVIKRQKVAVLPFYYWLQLCKKQSLSPVHNASRPPDNNPVDDLDKGDDAEAEKEAEESSKWGDEVHRAHPDAPLEF